LNISFLKPMPKQKFTATAKDIGGYWSFLPISFPLCFFLLSSVQIFFVYFFSLAFDEYFHILKHASICFSDSVKEMSLTTKSFICNSVTL
jgi:hypothetical protein